MLRGYEKYTFTITRNVAILLKMEPCEELRFKIAID